MLPERACIILKSRNSLLDEKCDFIFSEEQASPDTHGIVSVGEGGIFLHLCGLVVARAQTCCRSWDFSGEVVNRDIDS